MWDKSSIQRLLAENDKAVARAVVAIYSAQTDEEKNSQATLKENGVGFNQADARRGAYYAGYIKTAGKLTGRHLGIARTMMMKYWRQLAEIANAKQPVAVESKANAARVAEADAIDAALARYFRQRDEGEDVGNYEEEKMVFEERQAYEREMARDLRVVDWT